MKPISTWLVPVALTLCVALVIGALAWITQSTIAAERERALADARADVQERTRLALWRMDSLGAAFLLDESGYPDVESRLPVKLRFTMSPKGEIHTGDLDKNSPLETLRQTIGTGNKALECVSAITMTPASPPDTKELSKRDTSGESTIESFDRLKLESQVAANWGENAVRSKAVQSTLQNANPGRFRNAPVPGAQPAAVARSVASRASGVSIAGSPTTKQQSENFEPASSPSEMEHATKPSIRQAAMPQALAEEAAAYFVAEAVAGQPRVAWVDGLLLLARRVNGIGNDTAFDGAWIDEYALTTFLLGEVGDLFDAASLIPDESPGTDGMVLASFPFRLNVPPPIAINVPLRQSTLISLAMSWAAALIALAATMWLVRGVMRLSERRASFVSAVTHELRTPLTTFRLYSDMLESGAVKEEKRGDYLRVLSREADRLTHLVENVLAFSRIERGNARSQIRDVSADVLLDNMRERLEARLASAGLHLVLDLPRGLHMRADQTAVEHILFNLIDNAAKYAAPGDPPVVTITAARVGNVVCLRIRDHGPGIPPSEMKRIFRPFHKSAHEAAETKPGVGLGLALSRRLAKEQGGELSCLGGEDGAFFELKLPASGTS